MKKIILTGGGTAGHVTPNIALIPELKKLDFAIFYIGSKNGIEKQLINGLEIEYFQIAAGKLRRYFDIKNFIDFIYIAKGFFQSLKLIKKIKPDVIFSKGGFVAAPVVWAAYFCKVPVVVHESDITPGLANKISMPFANKICYSFPETVKYIEKYVNNKACFTGIPIRNEILFGNKNTGLCICGFTNNKPTILVMGGSLGSKILNDVIRMELKNLLSAFQICHLCGRGSIDNKLVGLNGYKQFEYVNEELPHLLAMADAVVSRAGATTLFELLALQKPNLLIPLSRKASRGDQILNAKSFKEKGFSYVLQEEELNPSSLLENILAVYNERETLIKRMKRSNMGNGTKKVIEVILEQIK